MQLLVAEKVDKGCLHHLPFLSILVKSLLGKDIGVWAFVTKIHQEGRTEWHVGIHLVGIMIGIIGCRHTVLADAGREPFATLVDDATLFDGSDYGMQVVRLLLGI